MRRRQPGRAVGLEGDLQARQVRHVLAQGEPAVETPTGQRFIGLVLGDQLRAEDVESRAVGIAPPVAQHAVTVEAAAFVVEAMADFMADHGADGAVVQRVVGRDIEKRRLQDGSGKDNLVERGVVVGVDRLWRHCPFLPVQRLTRRRCQTLPFKAGRTLAVAKRIVRTHQQLTSVTPALRVADLAGVLGQLFEGPGPGRRGHPAPGSRSIRGKRPAACSPTPAPFVCAPG